MNPIKSGPFTIRSVRWRYLDPHNVQGIGDPVRGDPISVDVDCDACGQAFTASREHGDRQPGAFRSHANAIDITCPSGKHTERIAILQLSRADR